MRLTNMMQALKNGSADLHGVVSPEKLEQVRTHPFFAKDLAMVRAQADADGGKPLPCIPYSYFKLFDETGSRTEFQSLYYKHRNVLCNAYVAALVDGTHIEDLEDAIWAVCDEYSWCLNAHFRYGGTNITEQLNPAPRADGKFEPYFHRQPQVIDLCASQTAADLAEITYHLEDKLAPAVVYRARKAIWERVLQPFMAINTPFWWETSPYNWAAVCACGVGLAAMYTIEDSDMLAPILTRCTESMECFLTGFKDDGVCTEGLGYWSYGFGFFMIYADMLKRRTGGAIDLFEDEKAHKVALFNQNSYLTRNNVACFADCGATADYWAAYIHYLYKRYGDVRIPDTAYAAPVIHGDSIYATRQMRHFLWCDPACVGGPLPDDEVHYDDTEWLLCRRTFGDTQVAFAVKGGNNDEPHNHNDVGSLLLDVGGEVLLGDIGTGLYNKKYFSDERYTLLNTGSHGHPVPLVNGAVQPEGVQYAAKNYTSGSDDDKAWAAMDIAPAYEVAALTSLQRTVSFYKKELKLEIADTYAFDGEALPVTERLVTKFRPELQDNGSVVIRGEKAAVRLLCPAENSWKITETEYERNSNDLHCKVWLVDVELTPAPGTPVVLTVTKF